jgi:hypothetical protein
MTLRLFSSIDCLKKEVKRLANNSDDDSSISLTTTARLS